MNPTRRNTRPGGTAWNDVVTTRSRVSRSRSTSATVTCPPGRNRGDSASTAPFSATRQCPPNTRSVLDSPGPAPAYTYAATHRPDWVATNCRRYAALPTVSLLADRFTSTAAPATA